MAMFSLSPVQVERYLISNEFKQFSIGISKELDVHDLFFGIDYKEAEKRFPLKTASLAFTHFENNFTKFDGIYFFTHRIASEAEKLVPACKDGRKKEEILKVLVDFVLIHELTHLSQFKRGCNEELRNHAKLEGEKYKNSWIEREANLQAYKYLKRRNEFTKIVSRCIWREFNEQM
jgi:hypothetical protein